MRDKAKSRDDIIRRNIGIRMRMLETTVRDMGRILNVKGQAVGKRWTGKITDHRLSWISKVICVTHDALSDEDPTVIGSCPVPQRWENWVQRVSKSLKGDNDETRTESSQLQ